MEYSRFTIFLLIPLLVLCTMDVMAVTAQGLIDEYPELESLTVLVPENEMSPMHLVAYRAVKLAMRELNFERGDKNILALTDAGFSIIADRYSTASSLEALIILSGCSKSNENLVVVHASKWRPLWFAFYRKGSGECIYIEVNSSVLENYMTLWETLEDKRRVQREFMALPNELLFSRVTIENVSASKLLSEPEAWNEKMVNKVFGGNEFSIMTISACWERGMPYELLLAAELHNHICPGLTSGILIIKYLDQHLPIEKPSQYYVILAVPPWCKDDAFQAIYDSTVGKRRMRVMMLSKEQSQQLPPVAGIYVRWDRSEDKGDAVVLTFDWDKACELCNINRRWFKDFKSYKWWYARLKMDLELMNYLDRPEEFISIVKEFPINSSSELNKLSTAGVNPYVEIGLLQKPEETTGAARIIEVVPSWVYVIIAILVVIIIITVAVASIKVKKVKTMSVKAST